MDGVGTKRFAKTGQRSSKLDQINPNEENVSFKDAVLDMGELFKLMKTRYQVPPAVTMDIVRLQMMFMQQSQQQPQSMDAPVPINSDVNEVIEAEPAEGQVEAFDGPVLVSDDE